MKPTTSKFPGLSSAVDAARALTLQKTAECKPKSPPLDSRVSSRLLEVAGSITPSKLSKYKLPPTLGKTPSFVSSRSEGEANSHDRDGSASYVEKYSRKYPDKELPFTDKDRAAAVAMGTRDIKVSLQVKKKKEKKQDEPEEREFQIRVALAEKELKHSDANRALRLINKVITNPGFIPRNMQNVSFTISDSVHICRTQRRISFVLSSTQAYLEYD